MYEANFEVTFKPSRFLLVSAVNPRDFAWGNLSWEIMCGFILK